jgi:hypothetical protein
MSRKFLLLFLVKVYENLDFYEFYKEHACKAVGFGGQVVSALAFHL